MAPEREIGFADIFQFSSINRDFHMKQLLQAYYMIRWITRSIFLNLREKKTFLSDFELMKSCLLHKNIGSDRWKWSDQNHWNIQISCTWNFWLSDHEKIFHLVMLNHGPCSSISRIPSYFTQVLSKYFVVKLENFIFYITNWWIRSFFNFCEHPFSCHQNFVIFSQN